MTRYFFDLHDNEGIAIDDEGLELPDLAAVRREAVLSLIEHVRDHDKGASGSPNGSAVEARDDGGLVMRVRIGVEILRRN